MSRFSRPSASALGRFLRLGGTGARIAGNLLVQRITPGKTRVDWEPIGALLGDTLGQMKGPVLKLGQQASQWRDVLPTPISAALARLQNQVPSLPFASLEGHLQRRYDSQLYELFEIIEPLPAAAAAASLGQVHRARDRQRRALIVKVQYPGIRAICDADMRQLRRLMPLGRLFGTVHGQRQIGCRWTTPENFRALVLGAAGGIGAALTARCTLTPRSAAAVALSHSTAPPLDFAGATSVHGPQ